MRAVLVRRRLAVVVVAGLWATTAATGGATAAAETRPGHTAVDEVVATDVTQSPPARPSDVAAVAGDRSVAVTWTAPVDAGAPVLGYVVTADPGGASVSVPVEARSATLPGLTNGTSYVVGVKAVNRFGVSTPALTAPVTPRPVITTFAGTGVAGDSGDGGPATDAQVVPRDVAVDSQGNVFISGFDRIRKVSPAGVISTVVGPDDLTLPSGHLGIYAIETGPEDELYWAMPDVVRKLQDGQITTVAGTLGEPDFYGDGYGDGGPATQARIAFVSGIAVTDNGDLFLADHGNNRIRRVSNGIITTFAGSGSNIGPLGDGGLATAATLQRPSGVTVAPDGAIYIADALNDRVRKVVDGIISTVAGNGTEGVAAGDGGPATDATVYFPQEIVVSPDGFMIASGSACAIREVVDGIIRTVAGSTCGWGNRPDFGGDGGPAIQAWLSEIGDLALDRQGRLFIADPQNGRVRMVSGFAPTPAPVAPAAPFGVIATAGHSKATVSWVPPTNGGSPIIGYRVTVMPGGTTLSAGPDATSLIVADLTPGTSYTFTVEASSAVGTGPASAIAGAIPTRAPSAPTGVSATAGDRKALVRWIPATAGTMPITGYRIESTVGGLIALAPATASQALVPGLDPTTAYRFTVTAVDSDGTGPASTSSNPVTPLVRAPFLSTDAFIRQVFVDFLRRQPTARELVDLRTAIDSGVISRASLVTILNADPTWNGSRAPVVRLYSAYFQRLPDTGGLDYWAAQSSRGLSLGDISALFASSPEFHNTYGALDNLAFARLVYCNVLDRNPDPGGLAYWVDLLNRGYPRGVVMTGFSESDEYRANTTNKVTITLLWRAMLGAVPSNAVHTATAGRLDTGLPLTTLIDELLLDPTYAARINR